MKLRILALSVVGVWVAVSVEVATLAAHTLDSRVGQYDFSGNDMLGDSLVPISDQSTTRFADSPDFSPLMYESIDSLSLTLGSNNAEHLFLLGEPLSVRVMGTEQGVSSGGNFLPINDSVSPQMFTYSVLLNSVTGRSIFPKTLAAQMFNFDHSESDVEADYFNVTSSISTISGTVSPVPLPAGGILLLGGLGAFAGLRRRKKSSVRLHGVK